MLLSDLDPSPEGSRPGAFIGTEDLTFFSANTAEWGREIWVSDGTEGGTRLLVDANPGSPNSYPQTTLDRHPMRLAGGRLFFIAETDGVGRRLWLTEELTGSVSGLSASPLVSAAGLLSPIGDRLLFTAFDETHGQELWISDGSAEGTHLLKDLEPGSSSSQIHGYAAYGAKTILIVSTDAHGRELWVTDGSTAGTVRISDLRPGEEDGICVLSRLESMPTGVVFCAESEEHGAEPWITDGTAAGTRLIKNIEESIYDSNPDNFTLSGGRVFFTALGLQLWVTDGTEAGTLPLLTTERVFHRIAAAGDKVYFPVLGDALEREPWVSDGTVEGTHLLKDVEPGPGASAPADFAAFESQMVFSAETSVHGRELWISDGTEDGTRLLADLAPGALSSDPRPVEIGGKLWLSAAGDGLGREPWKSDGTESGTELVSDLDQLRTVSSRPEGLTPFSDRVAFTFRNGTDPLSPERDRLWITDGTDAGSVPAEDPQDFLPQDPRQMTAFGESLYYFAASDSEESSSNESSAEGSALVRLDRDGRQFVVHEEPDPAGFSLKGLAAAGGWLYFSRQGQEGLELWRLRGDEEPLFLARLLSGLDVHLQTRLVPFDGRLAIFVPVPGSFATELWISDGTIAGTGFVASLAELTNGVGSIGEKAVVYRGRLYFPGAIDLWRSDGSPGNLERVVTLGQFNGPHIEDLLVFEDSLYFRVSGQLWRSDGTEAGTLPIASGLMDLWSTGDALYFTQNLPDRPVELIRAAGEPLRFEVAFEGEPETFFSAGTPGVTFFEYSASTDASTGLGRELWRTDGTLAGAALVKDIASGRDHSLPDELVSLGSSVLFVAEENVHGRELWAVDPICLPSPTTLCLGDGRFQVRAKWHDEAGSGHRGQARTRALTDDTGAFYFFAAENIELAVKVLDGRELTGHFWVFYASLSNVAFELEVFDTESGELKVYSNPAGTFASVGDTAALPASGAALPVYLDRPSSGPPSSVLASSEMGTCAASAEALCLGQDRFRLSVEWRDFEGREGVGSSIPLTGDTGLFWFFGPENIELVVKVLDATSFNGHHWVFYGSLSNVEFSLTVEDTVTGQTRTYRNPEGSFASVGDTTAF